MTSLDDAVIRVYDEVKELVAINDSIDAADQYLGDLLDSWRRSRGIDPEQVDRIEQEYRKHWGEDNESPMI